MPMSFPYIAVVKQPSVSSVFLVHGTGTKIRAVQHADGYCRGFAEGYLQSEIANAGYFLDIKYFKCDAGDAASLDWKPESA